MTFDGLRDRFAIRPKVGVALDHELRPGADDPFVVSHTQNLERPTRGSQERPIACRVCAAYGHHVVLQVNVHSMAKARMLRRAAAIGLVALVVAAVLVARWVADRHGAVWIWAVIAVATPGVIVLLVRALAQGVSLATDIVIPSHRLRS